MRQAACGTTVALMQPMTFRETADTARGDARRRSHGRSWTQALASDGRTAGPAARPAQPAELHAAAALGIDGVGDVRATIRPQAEAADRRGVPMEGAHISPQDTLPTLMAARARVPLVSGDLVGGARPMTAVEAARLMGVGLRSAAWQAAERRFSEQRLWEVVADAVDAHHVRAMWHNAEEMAEAAGWQLRGRTLRYAGSHVGALDTILMGGRTMGFPIVCRALAEWDGERMASAGDAYLVPEERRFGDVWALASTFQEALDVASITPSCKLLSSAMRGDVTLRRQEAWAQLESDLLAFERLVLNCMPTVIFVEESAGLYTHNRELYDWVQERLSRWPYEWRHSDVDAATLGASHRRRRLLWVGVLRRG